MKKSQLLRHLIAFVSFFLASGFLKAQINWYVNDASQTGDVYCSAVGSSGGTGTASDPFLTIGDAITAAGAGDTIYVDAGTYPGSTSPDKQLTFLGANAAIDPNTGTRNAESILTDPQAFRTATTSSVIIKGFRLTTTAGNPIDNYTTGAKITLENNLFDACIGPFFANPDSLQVIDNRFNDLNVNSSEGLFVAGDYDGTSGTYVDIHGNTWINGQVSGMNLSSVKGVVYQNDFDNIAYYGVLVANLCNLDIHDNVFNAIVNPGLGSPTWGAGVRFYTPASGLITSITNNFFTNNYIGVGVRNVGGDGSLAGTTVNVNNNSFSGNTDKNIRNQATQNLSATCNWFGSTNAATIAAAIEGPVTYSPYLTNGTDNSPSFGFQPVPNSCTGCPGGSVTNANTGITYCSIQAAINVASPGDVINVGAGTYPENVNVDRWLTLSGAGNTTIIQPVSNGPCISLNSTGSNSSERTIIKNLKVTGATGGGNTGSGISILTGLGYITVDNVSSVSNDGHGFAINHTGSLTDIIISNSTFSNNVNGSGFRIPTSLIGLDGLTITNSHFDGNGTSLAANSGAGIGLEINSATVAHPVATVVDASRLITNVLIQGSTFSNNLTKGIYAERLDNATIQNVTFSANGVTGTTAPAGIDINLKFNAFNNITLQNISMLNNAPNATGFYIKARNDGGTYGPSPASLTGVSLLNVEVTGSMNGIIFENNVNNASVHQSSIHGNSTVGLQNNIDGGRIVNATCNWWNSSTGPTNAGNPSGTGDKVSANVTFVPWLTSGTDNDLVTAGFQTTEVCAACALVLSTSSTAATCPSQNNGTASVTVSGGSGNYTYSWNTSPVQTTSTATGLVAGNYTVTVTDLNGCTNTGTVMVSNSTTGGPVHNTTTGLNYCTIQAAIDASATHNGDIITVDAGTYNESVNINKSVNLKGAQAGNCAASRTGAESIISCPQGIGINASNVTINGFTIQDQDGATFGNSGPGFGYAIFMAPPNTGTQLINNIIKNNTVGTGLSNAGTSPSQVLIRCNWFDSNNQPGSASGAGIYTDEFVSQGVVSNVLIDNNKFTGNEDAGIDFSTSDPSKASTGITISSNDFDGNDRAVFLYNVVSSTFSLNEIHNSTGTGSGDVRIFGGVNNFMITNNNFSNDVPHAIRITDDGAGATSSNITVHKNSFTGYSASNFAIENASGYTGTLDATCNWFGSTDNTVVAPQISGSVTYIPYLTSGIDADPSTPGFQTNEACGACNLSITSISSTNISCNGANDGSAKANVSGAINPSYLWTPGGQTTQTATGLAADNYTVTVTDGNGCSDNKSILITEPGVLNATVNSTDATCHGTSNGTITISSPTGGYGTYEYSISGGTSWSTNGNFTGLPSNTYNVQIRDAAHTSCVVVLNSSLFIGQPAALTITASSGGNGTVTPAGTSTVNCGGSLMYTITPASCYHIADVKVDNVSVGTPTSYTFSNVQASHTITATFAANSAYSITVTQASNGTITPGTTTVNCGGNQTFTITPNSCYHIASLTVDGASVTIASSYTFTNVQANHTITATYAASSAYTITVTQASNGTIAPGTSSVNCGGNKTFTITPNTCYHIASLTVDGSSVTIASSYTFTNVQANHTITATYAANSAYTITVTQASNGTIAPGTSTVNCGSNKTFTITPNTCYHIASLTVDGSPVTIASSYTFTNVQANHMITATYAANSAYTITVTQASNGTITPGTSTVSCGSNKTFTITPNACYHIASLTVDGSPATIASSYTFTNVQANHTITATYAASSAYTITVTQASNGTIAPGTSTVSCGSNKTFTITPNTCYHIASLTVDGSTVTIAGSYTFTNVQANHTITATYAANSAYTIAVTQASNGTITPGTSTVSCGSNKTFTITPNTCYHIASLTVDGSPVTIASSYTFTNVQANHTITATYAANSAYTITVTQASNGTIAPGTSTVSCGSNKTFTITPNTCYHIASLTVDGSPVTIASSYTFTNVQANHTITATFAANSPLSAGTISGPSTVCVGSTIQLTISGNSVTGAWSSTSTTTATVTSSGVVSGVKAGTVTIKYTVSNSCGSAVATKSIVVGSNAPVITCPFSSMCARNAGSSCKYTISGAEFNATASCSCGTPVLSYTLSGATSGTGTSLAGVQLNKGLTTITWKATSGSLSSTCSFTVNVNDTQKPSITCKPGATKSIASSSSYYTVSGAEFNAAASDNCGTPSLIYCLSGATVSAYSSANTSLAGQKLNVGATTITWKATDGSDNVSTCTTIVTVSRSNYLTQDIVSSLPSGNQVAEPKPVPFTVRVIPNPTSNYFTLQLNSESYEKFKITIVDVAGRLIEQRPDVPANSTLQLGSKYHPGVYIAEILQDKSKVVLRLIKEGN